MTSAVAVRQYFLDNPGNTNEYNQMEEKLILTGNLYRHKELILKWYHDERESAYGTLPALWEIVSNIYAYNDDIFAGLVMMDLIYEGSITKYTPEDILEEKIEEGVTGYAEIYCGSYDYLQLDTELAAVLDEYSLPYEIDEQSNFYDALGFYDIKTDGLFVANDSQNVLFPSLGSTTEYDEHVRMYSAGHYVWVGDIRCLR